MGPSCGDSQPCMLQVVVGSIHIWKEALAALRVQRHWHTPLAKSASLFFLWWCLLAYQAISSLYIFMFFLYGRLADMWVVLVCSGSFIDNYCSKSCRSVRMIVLVPFWLTTENYCNETTKCLRMIELCLDCLFCVGLVQLQSQFFLVCRVYSL